MFISRPPSISRNKAISSVYKALENYNALVNNIVEKLTNEPALQKAFSLTQFFPISILPEQLKQFDTADLYSIASGIDDKHKALEKVHENQISPSLDEINKQKRTPKARM